VPPQPPGSQPMVATLGEILVEIMAVEQGHGFRQPIELTGPFPSGAPAIFIDQVAKLGQPCAIVACVGDDDFGWLNIDRLAADGVSTEGIRALPDEVTGTAFVRYRPSGERDFIFNIKASASRRLRLDDQATRLLERCRHLHVSGPSLFSPEITQVALQAVAMVKGAGGSVSFDPNVRGNEAPETLAAFKDILARCDFFFPSGPELTLLTEADDPAGAVAEVMAMGVSAVVVKQGARGAAYYGPDGRLELPGYPVAEVDPTGAGDCFAATFVTCRLQGRDAEESLAYANAAGARAVTVRGPMEGTSTFAQLDELRSATGARAPKATGASRAAGRRLDAFVAGCSGEGWAGTGITSVCSGHPLVLEAAARQAADSGGVMLVEATCNQVNHLGGYTGMTPARFRDLVHEIAAAAGLPRSRVLLGGDHLGPSPWRDLPAEEALAEAGKMVAAYASAGYQKIHLDASMGCRGEPQQLPDELTAERAARLGTVAEAAASSARAVAGTGQAGTGQGGGQAAPDPGGRPGPACGPWYVIGTEVPAPGGARHEITQLAVTTPEAARASFEAHRKAFEAAGIEDATGRLLALVAQPGVEFDHRNVVVYQPERARELVGALEGLPGLVFEAHSTDYQPPWSLARLVSDGFAILKVGPGLTFALREALYGLDSIAAALSPSWAEHGLARTMEAVMTAQPGHWLAYYPGSPDEQRVLRHFSYSDRIRYYWSLPAAEEAVGRLFAQLSQGVPAPLVSQYLPTLYPRVAAGTLAPVPKDLVVEAVRDVLRSYEAACGAPGHAAQ